MQVHVVWILATVIMLGLAQSGLRASGDRPQGSERRRQDSEPQNPEPEARSQQPRATPQKLIAATPQHAVAAVYLNTGTADEQRSSPAQILMGLIGSARDMGIFGAADGFTRRVFDLIDCWPVIQRYRRAYVLHDIRLKQLDTGGNRLDLLALSVILETGPDNLEIPKLIQHFLNRYTNEQSGQLETISILDHPFHRLTDSSLPPWMVWEWGQVDDLFIVSLGAGSSERIIASLLGREPNLSQDEWFATGHQQARGAAADFEVYLDVASLQKRLGEAAQDRFYAVVDSLGIKSYQKSIWTVGSVGRAHSFYAYHRRAGVDHLERISAPDLDSDELKKLLPAEATGYAILNVDAADVLRRIRSAYLAAQRVEKRFAFIRAWDELAEARGINFEQEVLAQLGDHIIIHNHPQHPLRLPLMWTILIEIDGDSRKVLQTINETMSHFSARLELAATRKTSRTLAPRLQRSGDGIWYLQYGIYGPAVAVTEHWLAISYSPEALRVNLSPPPAREAVLRAPSPTDPAESQPSDAADQGKSKVDDVHPGT